MSRSAKTRFNHKPVNNNPYMRTTHKYPSADSGGASTSVTPAQQYTGTFLIGIGQMHKSNAIPITNGTSAVDIAKMRRN